MPDRRGERARERESRLQLGRKRTDKGDSRNVYQFADLLEADLRLSTRDMSEDRTFPNIEVRAPRGELLAGFSALLERLLAEVGQVNWGPKTTR